MRIGVISDTHNLVRPEIHDAFRKVDMILHAGDIGDLDVISELESIAPVRAVLGNNDFDLPARIKEHAVIELGHRKIRLQHIFRELPDGDAGEKHDIDRMIVFGHSHRPCNRRVGDTLYFNPGSAGPRRFDCPVTVGLLELGPSRVRSEIIFLVDDSKP